jgi:hypothetical protein
MRSVREHCPNTPQPHIMLPNTCQPQMCARLCTTATNKLLLNCIAAIANCRGSGPQLHLDCHSTAPPQVHLQQCGAAAACRTVAVSRRGKFMPRRRRGALNHIVARQQSSTLNCGACSIRAETERASSIYYDLRGQVGLATGGVATVLTRSCAIPPQDSAVDRPSRQASCLFMEMIDWQHTCSTASIVGRFVLQMRPSATEYVSA